MTFDWWTFGFQTINVLVLVWLLHRFFWRPVSSVIAARNAESKSVIERAEARHQEAEAALADIAATRAGFKVERDGILAEARRQAAQEKAATLQAARAESTAVRDAAKADIARQAETARKSAVAFASSLAETIAGQMAARLSGPAVDAAFQDWLITGLKTLDPEERKAIAGEKELDLVSARDLAPDERKRLAARISEALGSGPKIRFRTDPQLIEGFELRSPHFALRNSWQADLATISAGLRDPGARTSADDV